MNFHVAILHVLIVHAVFANKYSKKANHDEAQQSTAELEDAPGKIDFKTLDTPFRMNKINLLWAKAQHRLTGAKLKSLYSELKIHDKEEVTWKRLRSEGKDKDGLKEAELRRKLLAIMDMYGLLEHFEDGRERRTNPQEGRNEGGRHTNKSLFQDKKLNKLWAIAEVSGYSSAELAALKEEFSHHEDKIREYYSLLAEAKDVSQMADVDGNSVDDTLDRFNTLETNEDAEQQSSKRQDYLDKVQMLREHHADLKDSYDRLQRLTAKGAEKEDFLEPKVQALWRAALQSDFNAEELESLRGELIHYEDRLLKLRHLHHEALLMEDTHQEKVNVNGGKTNGYLLMQDNIKQHARKVEKLHMQLENKIMLKHIEL